METICGASFVFDHDDEPDMIENGLTGGAYPRDGRTGAETRRAADAHPPAHRRRLLRRDGELTFVFPDREVVAGPGAFVFIPRGVVHTARISKPLSGLLIYSPGDAEHITQPV